MTDRVIVYDTAIPQTLDVLKTSKFAMLGDAYLALATLGSDASSPSTVVSGLSCTPTSPASLQVNLGPGAIFSLDATDSAGYSDLGTDAIQVFKMGVRPQTGTLTITPPGTIGYSQVFLVQAILSNVDSGSTVLSYYNSSNPAIPYSGPSNSGTSQFTERKNVCTIALKAGVAATTGTQVTPTPDSGYTALYAITVANGQTQINSGHIVAVNGGYAPFINTALPYVPPAVQSGKWVYAVDSGSVNTMIAAVTPALTSYQAGLTVRVKAANTNTTSTTLNINGLGVKSVKRSDGATDVYAGEIVANAVQQYVYDGTNFQLIGAFGRPPLTIASTIYVNTTTGDDTSYNGSSATVSGVNGPFKTISRGMTYAAAFGPSAFSITIQVSAGTYNESVSTPKYAIPNVLINGAGALTTIVDGLTVGPAIMVQGPNTVTVSNLKGQNNTASSPIFLAIDGGSMITTVTASGNSLSSVFQAYNATMAPENHDFYGNSKMLFLSNFGGSLNLNARSPAIVYTIKNALTVSSATAVAIQGGTIGVAPTNTPQIIQTGQVTGSRYFTSLGGGIEAAGLGVNLFPGTVAGTTHAPTYGWYNP